VRVTSGLSSVREEAAQWHARLLRDRASGDTRVAFEAWLSASSERRAAYDAVQRTWGELECVSETPAILALRHEAALRLTRRTSTIRIRLWAVAAVIAMLAIGPAVFIRFMPPMLPDRLTVWVRDWLQGGSYYRTGTGERLVTSLKDGSQVTLDTRSELEVDFSPTERLVRLKRGQAFFDVAKDKRHPFVVEVRNRRFVAVGTSFDVRLDGKQIRVTMVEGTVRVEPAREQPRSASGIRRTNAAGASGSSGAIPERSEGGTLAATMPRATLITAGQQLMVDERNEERVRAADADRATSWRRGQVIFEGVRLGDAVAELNRYSDIQIELADLELANIQISGSFTTGRSDVFVEALTTYFPIAIAESDDREVVLKARR
jgi:transmembrane sensor